MENQQVQELVAWPDSPRLLNPFGFQWHPMLLTPRQPTLCAPSLVFYLLGALSPTPLLLGQLLLINFKEADHCLLWEADSPPVCIKGLSCASVYLALPNSNGRVIPSNPPRESRWKPQK